MTLRRSAMAIALCLIILPVDLRAQTSSIGAESRQAKPARPPVASSRETPPVERNLIYEQYAWNAVAPTPPKTFKPNDLITIVVREQRRWEADADLDSKKQLNLKSELKAFANLTQGGIGAAAFRRGEPNIDYKFQQDLKNQGDSQREDKLITRLSARIIDVKPNGLLVLEARGRIQHDEEISEITLTGTCRKEDVAPDNTVLSTQIAEKNVVITNEGALRAAATRGWLTKLLDWLKPI